MGGPAPIPAQVGKLPRFLSLEVPPSSSCTSGPANDDSQPSRAKDPRGGLFARQPTSIYSRHKGLKLLFEKGDRRKVHRTMRTRSNAYSLALKRRRRSVTDETASWTGRLVGGQGIPAGGRYRPRAAGDLQRVAGRKRRTCAQRPRQEGGWQFASSVEPGLMRDARFGADFAHASSSGSTAGIIAITSRTAMAMLNARAWPGSRSARRTNEPKASHGKLPANPATRNTIANAVA